MTVDLRPAEAVASRSSAVDGDSSFLDDGRDDKQGKPPTISEPTRTESGSPRRYRRRVALVPLPHPLWVSAADGVGGVAFVAEAAAVSWVVGVLACGF